MLNLSRFRTAKQPKQLSGFIVQLQKTVKGNQQFGKIVQNWRNIQINHIGSLMQLQAKIRDKIQQSYLQAYSQFLQLLETVIKAYKTIITKLNQQVFQTCFPNFQSIIQKQKQLITEQKSQNKDFICKKQQVCKLLVHQQRIKKPLYQDLIQQIFSQNSVSQSQNKSKIVQKVQQMYEKKDENCQKIRQAKQLYQQTIKRTKQNLRRFYNFQDNFNYQSLQTVKKARNGINLFAQSLSNQLQSIINQEIRQGINGESQLSKFQIEQEAVLRQQEAGYLQQTIHIIRNKSLDLITEYSKDKQIKKRIKGIIDTNQVSPQFTDQITRHVQLVKKIVKTRQFSLVDQFKNIMTKNWKSRLNFIFMLQLYRINSQFQITYGEIQAIVVLINQLLKICHKKKDAYIIKQTIILLLTYYVTVKNEQDQHKIYIIHFFKRNKLWKDLQLWESMLILSIYIEKKATLRMLLRVSQIKNNQELIQAQKTLVLNQILYIVKNMILFDFTEKQVKQYASKFVKLLKLDQKFLKDVYNTIQSAIKEQQSNLPLKQIDLQKHQFYKIILQNGQEQVPMILRF